MTPPDKFCLLQRYPPAQLGVLALELLLERHLGRGQVDPPPLLHLLRPSEHSAWSYVNLFT